MCLDAFLESIYFRDSTCLTCGLCGYMIKLKRVYDPPSEDDGHRILVDRIWPRGMTKEKARVDLWLKELGPSDELRKWFGHDPARWEEFRRKYETELKSKTELLQKIRDAEKQNVTVTLVYSAKDEEHNQAVVIQGFLKKH